MANKTNPIGVRFRQDILDKLKIEHSIESPQKALVFMEHFYVNHHKLAKDTTQLLRDEPEQKKEAKPDADQSNPPTTLDELKALCPKELTGFDRSAWIATKRQEYSI